MRGVLNLRGVMVPIIDLRCRFGQTEASDGPKFTSNCVRAD
jgi:chemotaxis signal transduction protein